MNTQYDWCYTCSDVVEIGIKEVGYLVLPAAGAMTGAVIGSYGVRAVLSCSLAGLLVGVAVYYLTPKAQRLICGACGTHLG